MRLCARLYNCARCQILVIICRCCDRGHIYCGEHCAQTSRAEGQCRASHKYRTSRRGRINNANRQRRYRERQREKVTQQGSAGIDPHDLLVTEPIRLTPVRSAAVVRPWSTIVCHFCGRICDDFLRRRFLDPPQRTRRRRSR